MVEEKSVLHRPPVRVALVGCGAVSHIYYAPVLDRLETSGLLAVEVLIDPNPERRAALGQRFSKAVQLADLDHLETAVDLAIVASPTVYHGEQVLALFDKGCHVLCEKPMAHSAAVARAMVEAAARNGRTLAVGHVRRFHAAALAIRELIGRRMFGAPRFVRCVEGHKGGWPARSDFPFRKESHGVLIDLGVHWLDLLQWWLGPPGEASFVDDALGGVDANCRLETTFGGVACDLKLSRSQDLGNACLIEFEQGRVQYNSNLPGVLVVSNRGLIDGELHLTTRANAYASCTLEGSFEVQVLDALDAVSVGRPPAVPGHEALFVVEFIEECYARRRAMTMPWLSREDRIAAKRLA